MLKKALFPESKLCFASHWKEEHTYAGTYTVK